jgi:hypothetical protein
MRGCDLSRYQAFAILWHLSRGDRDAARIVAALPPAFFAAGDALMAGAWAAGARDAGQD